MGNLRIKESLAAMNERPLLGFSRAEVSARDNRFLEYAHEQGAAMSGATGAVGEATKLLLTQGRDGLLYPDALLEDRLAACHWLVKCPPEQATPNDCDMLRSEFHYYRALQQLGIDTVPAQGLALEEERQPSLWMRRFDRRLHGQGVERLALESIYSLAGCPARAWACGTPRSWGCWPKSGEPPGRPRRSRSWWPTTCVGTCSTDPWQLGQPWAQYLDHPSRGPGAVGADPRSGAASDG